MDAGYVIISVLVALLSVWGALSIGRGLFAWLFAPPQVRGCVVLRDADELKDLDFLLTEAEQNCNCRKGVSLVVVVTPEVAQAMDGASGTNRRIAQPEGERSPVDCIQRHGAILLVCESRNSTDTH